MTKLVLAAMVMESGNVEDAVGQEWNIAHYAVERDLRNGSTLADYVIEQE